MNVVEVSAPGDRSSFVVTDSPRDLANILLPDINVAVWRRSLPHELTSGLRNIATWLDGEVEVLCDAAHPEIQALTAGLPPGIARADVAFDITMLVVRFVGLTRCSSLRACFGTVSNDKCRKFHADYVGLRLVTTYVGPGTEWVPDAHVARSAMALPPEDAATANAAIVPESHRIRQAHAGDVVLLKGQAWPGQAGRGAVHRSPPISLLSARRMVLVLTTVT